MRIMKDTYEDLETVDDARLANWLVAGCRKLLGKQYLRKKKFGKPAAVRISTDWLMHELSMTP